MSKTTYHISLKGYVGGYDFDRATVDKTLAKNAGKEVSVLIDSLGASLVTGSRWERYLELRSQVIDLEASLAEEWLSPELLSALRSENLHSDLTEKRGIVVQQIKAQVVGYLRSGSFNSRRLADIVNFIRQDESAFKEWHQSETAKLFAPPIFRNEKKASGYFF